MQLRVALAKDEQIGAEAEWEASSSRRGGTVKIICSDMIFFLLLPSAIPQVFLSLFLSFKDIHVNIPNSYCEICNKDQEAVLKDHCEEEECF